MVRVKVCGITCADDAITAANLGADAIGLNFYKGPRHIGPEKAADILRSLPPFCTPVALIHKDNLDENIIDLLGNLRISFVQLYGQADSATIQLLAKERIRLILTHQVRPDTFPGDLNNTIDSLKPDHPAAILLDAYHEKLDGGTGTTADWDSVANAMNTKQASSWPPVMLAGGLNPDNVAQAIQKVRPWAVDVSSGVESSPGKKDHEALAAFINNARNTPIR